MIRLIKFLFLFLFCGSSYSIIPLPLLNGSSLLFDKHYRHLDPSHGYLGIYSGFSETTRFYGRFSEISYNKMGERQFGQEKTKDPLTGLSLLLFPSLGGTFSTTSCAQSCLGRYMSPASIALLLSYVQDARKKNKEIKSHMALEGYAYFQNKKNNLLSSYDFFSFEDKELDNKFLKFKESVQWSEAARSNLKLLREYVDQLVEEEYEGKQPKYIADYLIQSFFWNHFTTRDDLLKYYDTLDQEKLIKSKALEKWKKQEPLTYEKLISFEEESKDKTHELTLSDFVLLKDGKAYYANQTPFLTQLITNGSAYRWNRKTNQDKRPNDLADCGECVIRHLFNLLLFDGKNGFNYEAVKHRIKEKHSQWTPNQAFENLVKFYQKCQSKKEQTHLSDRETRTFWNGVVAQLNDEILNLKEEFLDEFHKVHYAGTKDDNNIRSYPVNQYLD